MEHALAFVASEHGRAIGPCLLIKEPDGRIPEHAPEVLGLRIQAGSVGSGKRGIHVRADPSFVVPHCESLGQQVNEVHPKVEVVGGKHVVKVEVAFRKATSTQGG
jgi:hypothetical protein